MFDGLRKSFTRFSKTIAEKDLNEADIEEVLEDLEMSLLQSDVALEVVEEISSDLKRGLVGTSVNRKQLESFVKGALTESVSQLFQKAGSLDLLENIRKKNTRDEPYTIVFLGINGTGKTTTLAKFAYMLKKNSLTVAIAAADTFRAGAIEQIREHGEKLQIKVIAQNYNSDPAAVCRDAILYAKSHRTDCVLIDTAGRIQTSTNLMQQIEKITNVVNPDLKIFVGDSLAGNDAISQAREFHEYTDFDCSVLTKSDADTKGGSALSIIKITSKPILYLGVGQEYPDLKEFKWESFVEAVLGERESMDGEIAAKIQVALETPIPADNIDIHDVSSETVSDSVLESEIEAKTETINRHTAKQEHTQADPFEGIVDSDIATYSDIHDVPPPESDEAAHTLAADIKEWISQGRPAPKDVQSLAVKEQIVADEIEGKESVPEETDDETIKQESDYTIETIHEDTQKSGHTQADPFEGIVDSDIATYSDIHDVPPPESDEAAHTLAADIKEWISQGRPAPKDDTELVAAKQESQHVTVETDSMKTIPEEVSDEEESKIKDMPESEENLERKHKKKRGVFGFFRRK